MSKMSEWMDGWMEWIPLRLLWLRHCLPAMLKRSQYSYLSIITIQVFLHGSTNERFSWGKIQRSFLVCVHFSMSTIYKINDNYSNLSFATIWRFCELAKCPSKWNKRLQTRNPCACYCTLLMVIAIKKPKGNCLQKICMLYTFEHIALPSFPAIWVYRIIFPINNNRDNLFGKLALCWPNFWIGQNF